MVPAVSRAVREAPALHLEALPGLVAAAVAFLANATPAQQAAAWSVLTIAGGIVSGLVRRPPHVAVTSALVTTVTANLAVLGAHLPHQWAALALAAASLVPVMRTVQPQPLPPARGGLVQAPPAAAPDSVPFGPPAR